MIAVGALAGLALGLAYFWALKASLNVRRVWMAVAAAARFAAAGAGFWALAQAGAPPLLAGLAGFVAGRWLMMRWAT